MSSNTTLYQPIIDSDEYLTYSPNKNSIKYESDLNIIHINNDNHPDDGGIDDDIRDTLNDDFRNSANSDNDSDFEQLVESFMYVMISLFVIIQFTHY